MNRIFFVCIIISLSLTPAGALDCSQIVITSDRSYDPFLLWILFSLDLTDQVCILKHLGQRPDPYVEDYISGLLSRMTPSKKERYEYLLRVLLFSVFHPDLEDDEIAARVLINKRGIKDLISKIQSFSDPVLKCQIMWIIPSVHDLASFSFCMTEGNYLISILQETMGTPDPLINEEIICLLKTVQQIGNTDYLFLCESFVELSRNKGVVDIARQTLRILLSREKE
jgi:hypothetical protein